jgi:hypothetical protein
MLTCTLLDGPTANAVKPSGVGLGLGGAVRRSETFIIPIASCLQGKILAPSTARLPTAGSVALGH